MAVGSRGTWYDGMLSDGSWNFGGCSLCEGVLMALEWAAAMTASAVKAVRKVGCPCCLVCHPQAVVLGVGSGDPLGAPSDSMEGSVGACDSDGVIVAISAVAVVPAPSDFARGRCSVLICTTVVA